MTSTSERPLFWGKTHPLTEDYLRLCSSLIPVSGNTTYLESESLRAASRLLYELNNNGGGNPRGYEVNFLLRYGSICGLSPQSTSFLKANIAKLGSHVLWPDTFSEGLELVVEEVVSHLLKMEKEGRALMPGQFDLLSEEYSYDPHDICARCGVDCTENNISMNYEFCYSCFRAVEEEQREQEESNS